MLNEVSDTPSTPSQALPAIYGNHSLSHLRAEIIATQKTIADLQNDLGLISIEIGRRFAEPLLAQMAAKNARSATIDASEGFKFKGSVGKTVTWDSSALQELAAEMDWAKAQHYFKIKFSVAEAMFKSVEPGPFKDALTAARTTKDGQLKIEMIVPKTAGGDD